jgi:uncharacterized protein (DUF983 family)
MPARFAARICTTSAPTIFRPISTSLIVGHVGVGGFTMAEALTDLSGWVHLAIWIRSC